MNIFELEFDEIDVSDLTVGELMDLIKCNEEIAS